MKLIRRIRNAVRAFRWEGAEPTESRAQTPSNYSNHAESASTNRGRVQLIWEARDLENNHPLVSGILRKLTPLDKIATISVCDAIFDVKKMTAINKNNGENRLAK